MFSTKVKQLENWDCKDLILERYMPTTNSKAYCSLQENHLKQNKAKHHILLSSGVLLQYNNAVSRSTYNSSPNYIPVFTYKFTCTV